MNEEENHSVFVVSCHPLPQQVDQRVGVDGQTNHHLHGVDCDADNICHGEPDQWLGISSQVSVGIITSYLVARQN